MTRRLETTELFHPAPRAGGLDRGTTMSEDILFTMVGQHTDRLLDEAAAERLLHADGTGGRPRPALRVRLGHALMGLGGHIAGARAEPPAVRRRPVPPSTTRPAC